MNPEDSNKIDEVSEAFYIACFQGDLRVVKEQINLGGDQNITMSNGWTAMHGAAYSGHLAVLKFLVMKGLDPFTTNALGQQPLHLAAAAGKLDVVTWFVNVMFADPKAQTAGGSTVADIAGQAGHLAILDFLGENSDG
jgi:ankyrin repeat protein